MTAELQALIDEYDSTDNERHNLMTLSVLPPEHYNSKQKIMKLFNCSRYKVQMLQESGERLMVHLLMVLSYMLISWIRHAAIN